MYVPKLATVLVDEDIAQAYADAKARKEAPREAWLLQCVQEDRSNPLPCTKADKELWGADNSKNPYAPPEPPSEVKPAVADAAAMNDAAADAGTDAESDNMDDLFKEMMGSADAGAPDAATDAEPSAAPKDDMDDLFKEMMGTDKKK